MHLLIACCEYGIKPCREVMGCNSGYVHILSLHPQPLHAKQSYDDICFEVNNMLVSMRAHEISIVISDCI